MKNKIRRSTKNKMIATPKPPAENNSRVDAPIILKKTPADLVHWKSLHEMEKYRIAKIRRQVLEAETVNLSDVYNLVLPVIDAVNVKLGGELLAHLKAHPEDKDSPLNAAAFEAVDAVHKIKDSIFDKLKQFPTEAERNEKD